MLLLSAACLLLISPTYVSGLDPYTVIVKNGQVMDATLGTTMEIRCDVNSRPDGINTHWERETYECKNEEPPCRMTLATDRLPSDQQKYGLKFVASDTYILIIKNVDENDEGTYFCQLPVTRFVKVYDRVYIRVIDPPSIDPLETSSDQFVAVGDTVELKCNAFGRPTPLIRWTRAGNGIMPGGGFVRTGSTLTIPNMRSEFRGPYICTAINDVGQAHRTINVDMNFPPEVYASPATISQKVGYETRLFCHVNAQPSASVSWRINGEEITNDNSEYRITTYESAFKKVISKLTVYEVKSSTYSADIRCIATSIEGTGETVFKIEEAFSVQPIPGASSTATQISAAILSSLMVFSAYILLQ